jgi:ABC-type Fe3+/spermidine/putrescine transport system ATPase subunit
MSFLSLSGVRKSFGGAPVVRDVSLAVERGEFVTLLGPSGCGKTTILRMIAGFERPSAGAILIGGRDVTHLSPSRRAIGMVFQAYALFPNMTVERNIGFGLRVAGKPAAEIAERVAEMLALIKLPDLAGRYPHQLSGGQQQRVSLARALAPGPGTLNTLRGVIADPGAGAIRVGEATLFATAPIDGAKAGEARTLALRPEALRLGDGGAGANRLSVVVEDVSFLGAVVRIKVRFEDTVLLADVFNAAGLALPRAGETVEVGFRREDLIVLEEA